MIKKYKSFRAIDTGTKNKTLVVAEATKLSKFDSGIELMLVGSDLPRHLRESRLRGKFLSTHVIEICPDMYEDLLNQADKINFPRENIHREDMLSFVRNCKEKIAFIDFDGISAFGEYEIELCKALFRNNPEAIIWLTNCSRVIDSSYFLDLAILYRMKFIQKSVNVSYEAWKKFNPHKIKEPKPNNWKLELLREPYHHQIVHKHLEILFPNKNIYSLPYRGLGKSPMYMTILTNL